MSYTRKLQKKLTFDPYHEGLKQLPHLNQTEFSNKLNDLLEKVGVQNRYASRISQANVNQN
jgi:hypothetical protein